jgi:hypothetical protein
MIMVAARKKGEPQLAPTTPQPPAKELHGYRHYTKA